MYNQTDAGDSSASTDFACSIQNMIRGSKIDSHGWKKTLGGPLSAGTRTRWWKRSPLPSITTGLYRLRHSRKHRSRPHAGAAGHHHRRKRRRPLSPVSAKSCGRSSTASLTFSRGTGRHPHERGVPARREDRGRRGKSSIRRAAATIRWPWTCDCISRISRNGSWICLKRCGKSLVKLAEDISGVVMPGYTHLQRCPASAVRAPSHGVRGDVRTGHGADVPMSGARQGHAPGKRRAGGHAVPHWTANSWPGNWDSTGCPKTAWTR